MFLVESPVRFFYIFLDSLFGEGSTQWSSVTNKLVALEVMASVDFLVREETRAPGGHPPVQVEID